MRALPDSGISAANARIIISYLAFQMGPKGSPAAANLEVGRALVDQRCGRCHSLDRVYKTAEAPEEWRATHLLDVPSSDQHTVKPWFNGKLDFSPEVKDFASQGFPLIGGGLEYLMDRPVAALVYQRRQHIINVFTWPASSAKTGAAVARNGYVALHWNHGSTTFWAVSDISSMELAQFESLYEK